MKIESKPQFLIYMYMLQWMYVHHNVYILLHNVERGGDNNNTLTNKDNKQAKQGALIYGRSVDGYICI